MADIEYTKCKNEFLLTAYTKAENGSVKFRFHGASDGELLIGSGAFRIENGISEVKTNSLKEGTYTPVLQTENGSYVCDKIKIPAGVLTPKICESERTLRLTEKIISAETRIEALEEKLSEISSAVYGKSIL